MSFRTIDYRAGCGPLFAYLACLIGSTSSSAWADELRPPWKAGPCTLWTRIPPAMRYLAPLKTDDGLWAAAFDGAVLMRQQADWTMSLSPADFAGGFRALGEGTGWIAAVGFTHSIPQGSKIFVRTDGQWNEIAEVSYPAVSFRTTEVDYVSGGGRNLFVATLYGSVFHYDLDAMAWRPLSPPVTGPSRGLWGDLDNLYFLYQSGSSVEMTRFDGTSWTHLPSPAFQGFSSVAGLSADEVYGIAASRLYRVDGPIPIEAPGVACGGTPIYRSLSAAEGQLVAEVSCAGQYQLWKRELDTWTLAATLPDPLPGYGSLRVSRNGQVYIGGTGGAIFRVLSKGLESLEQSAPPRARVLGGTSVSNLFSGADEGVAQLIDGQWQPLAGSPPNVRDLWQAPSGVLFATAVEIATPQLWKYDGTQWLRLRSDSASGDQPHVYGRSESDYYYSFGANVLHWDGAAWTPLPVMPCTGPRSFVQQVTFAGSNIVLVNCFPGFGLNRLLEFDGTSWATLMPLPQFDIYQAGPAELPVTYLIEWQGSSLTYRVRSQSAWAQLPLPTGYRGRLTSVDGSRFVSSDGDGYATTDGSQPWLVVSEWPTRSTVFYRGILLGLWTDGQFAASTRNFGGEPDFGGPGQSIVLCDLGQPASAQRFRRSSVHSLAVPASSGTSAPNPSTKATP